MKISRRRPRSWDVCNIERTTVADQSASSVSVNNTPLRKREKF